MLKVVILLPAMMLTTALAECNHNGQMVPEGPLPTDACCSCFAGQILCASVSCNAPCVDAVSDPKHCCPVCPNGPNCRGPDGETIQEGDEVKVGDSGTATCEGGQLLLRYVRNDAPEFHPPEAPELTDIEAPELKDTEAP